MCGRKANVAVLDANTNSAKPQAALTRSDSDSYRIYRHKYAAVINITPKHPFERLMSCTPKRNTVCQGRLLSHTQTQRLHMLFKPAAAHCDIQS